LKQKGILFEKKIFTVLSTNFGQSRKFRTINILNQESATDSGKTLKNFLTNIKLKGINELKHEEVKGMACGMKHPKTKKTTKKATSKKK